MNLTFILFQKFHVKMSKFSSYKNGKKSRSSNISKIEEQEMDWTQKHEQSSMVVSTLFKKLKLGKPLFADSPNSPIDNDINVVQMDSFGVRESKNDSRTRYDVHEEKLSEAMQHIKIVAEKTGKAPPPPMNQLDCEYIMLDIERFNIYLSYEHGRYTISQVGTGRSDGHFILTASTVTLLIDWLNTVKTNMTGTFPKRMRDTEMKVTLQVSLRHMGTDKATMRIMKSLKNSGPYIVLPFTQPALDSLHDRLSYLRYLQSLPPRVNHHQPIYSNNEIRPAKPGSLPSFPSPDPAFLLGDTWCGCDGGTSSSSRCSSFCHLCLGSSYWWELRTRWLQLGWTRGNFFINHTFIDFLTSEESQSTHSITAKIDGKNTAMICLELWSGADNYKYGEANLEEGDVVEEGICDQKGGVVQVCLRGTGGHVELSERAKMETTFIQAEKQEVEDESMAMMNIVTDFSELDLTDWPQLAQAVSEDSRMVRGLGNMSTREQGQLFDQLEQFLPKLASHSIGYNVVVEMVRQFEGTLLDRLVRILCGEFILLSQSPAGAKCLLSSLNILPIELQQRLVLAYSDISNYHQAVDHLTGPISSLVFQSFLPMLGTSLLRRLVLLLSPGLVSLADHRSLSLLVEHADHTDQQVLFLLASQLDAERLVMAPDQSALAVQLVSTGNVSVCNLVLHNMSGMLATILNTDHGRDLVSAFIRSATDVQVEQLLEELLQEQEDKAPIIVQLVVDGGKQHELMNAVARKAGRDVLVRMMNMFKVFEESIITSACGGRWMDCISRKVSSDYGIQEQKEGAVEHIEHSTKGLRE